MTIITVALLITLISVASFFLGQTRGQIEASKEFNEHLKAIRKLVEKDGGQDIVNDFVMNGGK